MDHSNPSDQNISTSTEQQGTPADAPAVEPAVNTAQSSDPASLFADQLAEIKTDDGRQKYADVQTALSSIPHAQTFISEQGARIKALEEELAKRQGMEQVLEQLQSQQAVQETTPPQTGVADIDVGALLDAKLQEREIMAAKQANQEKVLTALQEKFGDKAEAQFNAKADELGISVGFLSDLARNSPTAALAYFNQAPAASPQPSNGTVNTSVFDSKPQTEDRSYMKIFQSAESDTMKKWRASGDAIASN
jgi:hypothetical protein